MLFMYQVLARVFALSLGCFSSVLLWADAAESLPNSFPDPSFVSWFGIKNITDNQDQGRFTLALGAMENRNGRWLSETTQALNGTRWRRVFELPRDRDQQDVLSALKASTSQLKRVDNLFSCRGHTCGSSNAWANQHFGVRQLYGLEQAQWYRADKVIWQGRQWIQAVYGVTRGNRRTYVLIDRFYSDEVGNTPSSLDSLSSWITTLDNQGAVILSDVKGDVAEPYRKQLLQLLKEVPNLSLAIIASASADNAKNVGSEAVLEASEKASADLKQKLVAAGAPEARLIPIGVGDRLPERQSAPMVWIKRLSQ